MNGKDNKGSIPEKILIVEDSKTLAKYLVRKIQASIENVQVDVVRTYADLKMLLEKENDYILALLDIYLPDMHTEELVDYVLSREIPSIVMTADFHDTLYQNFGKKNIVDFVLKDSVASLEYIVNLVHRLIENRKTTVLAVDDSAVVLHQIRVYLESQLYRIKLAKDPVSALAQLEQDDNISIVITDYNMPLMDGIAFLQKIRKIKNKDVLGVIGISVDSQSAAKFLKFGANDFINKPFHKEEFIHRINNLSQSLEHTARLKAFANHDFMTQVYNRKYFFEEGERYFKEAVAHEEQFAVAMIDIDDFKQINDTWGHDIGDSVIKTLAKKLKDATKGDDLVARFGGEEFCLLLKNISPGAAQSFFENICRTIASLRIQIDTEKTIGFTVSIGLETASCKNLTEMIKGADIQLYKAKQNGKNRVETDIKRSVEQVQAQFC